MAEIILSFFAVIGMLFLIVYVCDYFFYRTYNENLVLTIDTRVMTIEACIDSFELISSVRQTASGRAILSNLCVIVSDYYDEKAKLSREYMRVFHIPGKIEVEHKEDVNR